MKEGLLSSGMLEVTAITIPASAVPGFYYYVFADADSAVTEAQENNSTMLRAILVVAGT